MNNTRVTFGHLSNDVMTLLRDGGPVMRLWINGRRGVASPYAAVVLARTENGAAADAQPTENGTAPTDGTDGTRPPPTGDTPTPPVPPPPSKPSPS